MSDAPVGPTIADRPRTTVTNEYRSSPLSPLMREANAEQLGTHRTPTIADRLTPEQTAMLQTWLDQGDA